MQVTTKIITNIYIEVANDEWRCEADDECLWNQEDRLKEPGDFLKGLHEIILKLLEQCGAMEEESMSHGDLLVRYSNEGNYTEQQVQMIVQGLRALEVYLESGGPLRMDRPPYIYNKSGNPNYNDPEWRFGDWELPPCMEWLKETLEKLPGPQYGETT